VYADATVTLNFLQPITSLKVLDLSYNQVMGGIPVRARRVSAVNFFIECVHQSMRELRAPLGCASDFPLFVHNMVAVWMEHFSRAGKLWRDVERNRVDFTSIKFDHSDGIGT
jgi:hypothetical protein